MKLIYENENRLKSFYDLNNAEELKDEIIQKLKQFDKDQNSYQTDVYLYVDDNMNGTLEDFTNVGGNSWLDDDHYVLFTDKQSYEDWTDFWDDEDDIADALGMTTDELKQLALDYANRDEDDPNYQYDIDDIRYFEVADFIKNNDEYFDKLEEIRKNAIDTEYEYEYGEKAKEIINEFDEDLYYKNNTDRW